MDISEIKELLTGDYNPNHYAKYKAIYKTFYKAEWKGCDCDAIALFNRLKGYLPKFMELNQPVLENNIIEEKKEEVNKIQPKGSNGKFVSKKPKVEPVQTDMDFINAVKDEIYQGYNYEDRIRKAYFLITNSIEPISVALMKRTIINYN